MARMYKCSLCKSDIPSDNVYVHSSISTGGKIVRKRYCSEDEFNEYQHEMTCRKMIFDIMRDLLRYEDKQILPTTVNKKVSELHNGYTYNSIYETFISCMETLKYWCGIDGKFDKEYQKISYIFAIITNSINEIDKKIKRGKELDKKKDAHTVEFDVFNDMPIVTTNKRDISSFLD